MIERTLFTIAFDDKWGRQMRLITGPRQSGKTTLSKLKLSREKTEKLYYLWDLRSVRECYRKHELFFTQELPPAKEEKRWVCFDEIHKVPHWKNILKGIFDATEEHYQFIVTGSAKLNISKMAGDSLSGRYFTFHLFPLTMKEVIGRPDISVPEPQSAIDFVLQKLNDAPRDNSALADLLEYGGFPEPFIHQSETFRNKWSQDYLDRVITEDIGTLTRIADRDKLYDLYKLLPEMIGSPISENSLANHLASSPLTVKNYLKRLEDFFLIFRITPYSRNIKRSLLKASKCYLYDWTSIEDKAKRFENYVAVELNTRLNLWSDLTGIEHALFYIRDKNKKETDFLITRQKKPWLMVEVKYSDSTVGKHHLIHAEDLGKIPVVQLCYENQVAAQEARHAFRISASRFLS